MLHNILLKFDGESDNILPIEFRCRSVTGWALSKMGVSKVLCFAVMLFVVFSPVRAMGALSPLDPSSFSLPGKAFYVAHCPLMLAMIKTLLDDHIVSLD